MSLVDMLTWFNQNECKILDRWQTALRAEGPTLIREIACGQDDPRQAIYPLYQVVLDAIKSQEPLRPADVASWASRYWPHVRGTSEPSLTSNGNLVHCSEPFPYGPLSATPLKAAAALRTAIGQTWLASRDGQSPDAAWSELLAPLDQVVTCVSELFIQAVEDAEGKHRMTSERALDLLQSIYDISQTLSASLNEEETFDNLVRKLSTALDAEHCALWLSDVRSLRVVALHRQKNKGPASASLPSPVPIEDRESPLSVAFESDKSTMLTRQDASLGTNTRQLMDELKLDALLVVPLAVQEIPIGVVSLGREGSSGPFDPVESALAEAVVRQAAIVIQNAGLYEEVRALNRSLEERVASRTRELAEEKERIETLYAIGRELSTTLELDQVLNKTLQLVSQAVGANHGSIMLLDRKSEVLVYRARLGGRRLPPEGKPTPFKAGVGVAGWVLQYREPTLISDVMEDSRWIQIPGKKPLTRSLIAAPLMVGDDIHGVLLIADRAPNAFSESQFKLVVASARQVAQTISNVQLYNYVVESAERLGQLLRKEQEERSKSQAILQSIADGVIVNDTKHKVIVFNNAAAEILGVQPEEVVGRDVRPLFDAFSASGRQETLSAQATISTSTTLSPGQGIETTLESEQKIISAHMAPVVTETGESLGVVTALRDITPEVEADRAKSEFVSTVSHELRTPLTSIKGYSDLLYAGAVGEINEQQKHFVGIIRNNADRLTALINDLLDISRIETGRVQLKIESVDMAEIVQDVLDSMHEQIEGKGLKLETELSSHAPEIVGDRDRLIQIVTNLLNNACKYTDEGWIRVSLTPLKNAVRLDVADSGIGISTEDQGRIFERFYRADTPVMEGRGGTGLGLAITKQLTELHGGRVWVKSELGVGSTFTIVLPAAAQGLPQRLLAELPAGAKKILVVDDERDIVALLSHHLSTHGYHVVTASTGEQAVVQAIREQPDLITLDVLLPDRYGFDVLRELKSRPETAKIPVIILSVVQDESKGYRLGAVDYIVKPVDEQRLLESVARIFHQKGKILIAEDNQVTADMIKVLLKKNGYEPLHATDGYGTVEMARRERPGIILLDLRMPGLDGYEALTELKRNPETKSIPIVVMSAHAVDPVQERLRVQAMGAEDFLFKPFPIERLLQEIERVAFGEEEPSK